MVKKGLIEIKIIFDKLQLRFFLIDKILLDAVCKVDFIKWNYTINLAIFEEEIMPNTTILLNKLFDGGVEISNFNPFTCFFKISIVKNGSKFSFVGLRKSKNRWYYNSNFRYPSKLFDNAKAINFFGNKYLAPFPPEEMLDFTYKKWRMPFRFSGQYKYSNRDVYMPKYLTILIKIRHFISLTASYLLNIKINLILKISPDKREYLFSNIMLKKALSKNCVFIEIGSSDGLEMSNAINFTKGLVEGYLIEPSVENLEKSRKRIQYKVKKYNTNISYSNKAVSSLTKNLDYYFSAENSNLSSIYPTLEYTEKRKIESTTIKSFLLDNCVDLSRHIVIKMDVEGAEVEILKSSLDIFKKIPNLSILFEVHPHMYHSGEMEAVLRKLFDIGFKVKLIESAGLKSPNEFIENELKPVKEFGYRALYENISDDFAIKVISKNILDITRKKPFLTLKIVRSVFLKKRSI